MHLPAGVNARRALMLVVIMMVSTKVFGSPPRECEDCFEDQYQACDPNVDDGVLVRFYYEKAVLHTIHLKTTIPCRDLYAIVEGVPGMPLLFSMVTFEGRQVDRSETKLRTLMVKSTSVLNVVVQNDELWPPQTPSTNDLDCMSVDSDCMTRCYSPIPTVNISETDSNSDNCEEIIDLESPSNSPYQKKSKRDEHRGQPRKRMLEFPDTARNREGMSDDDEDIQMFKGRWPVFSRANDYYPSKEIIEAMLHPDKKLLCDSVPIQCQENMTFLIETDKLKDPNDITGDDNGKYKRPSSHKYTIEIENAQGIFPYIVRRRNYVHAGTPSFRRMIYKVEHTDGKPLPFVMLQYLFIDGEIKDLVYEKHGNGKQDKPFMPRTKRTIDRAGELSKVFAPGKVLSRMLEEEGGPSNINRIAETPRDASMIYYAKSKEPLAHRSRSGPSKISDFNEMFRLASRGDFVRSFELSGEHPRAYCTSEQQILDIKKHCTGENGSILQIDPTFGVGNFYVTTSCYRHPDFINYSNRKPALMPGPYCIHAKRETEDYAFFGHHLSSDLKDETVTYVGTDGEKALINGLRKSNSFATSTWMTCMIHSRENCERKIKKLGVTDSNKINEILHSIYGREEATYGGRVRHLGLVDSETEADFETQLNILISKWDNLCPLFSDWFIQFKKVECLSVLASIRRRAGLGDVPSQFTTNDAEAENSLVKRAVNWQKVTWGEATNILQEKVLSHYDELSRALFREGKYRVSPNSNIPDFQPYDWAGMDVNERRRHLQRAGLKQTPISNLSVLPEESSIQGFGLGDLQDVWSSASSILSEETNIVHHPNNVNKYAVFEQNSVYTVTKELDLFTCGGPCEKYNYFSKMLCSHTLAVAEKLGDLVPYLIGVNTKLNQMSVSSEINRSCVRNKAGQKGSKRKGRNGTLSSAITSSASISASTFSQSEPTGILPCGTGHSCAQAWQDLPPLTPLQHSVQDQQPFMFTFRQGLISRCFGCLKQFSKKTTRLPNDLILKKMDYREYPKEGMWYRSSVLTNTYYHLNIGCMRRRYPRAQVRDIFLASEIQMSAEHIELMRQFGFDTLV